MRIAIPKELVSYIRLRDGEIIIKKKIPDDLEELFEKFRIDYQNALKLKNQIKEKE